MPNCEIPKCVCPMKARPLFVEFKGEAKPFRVGVLCPCHTLQVLGLLLDSVPQTCETCGHWGPECLMEPAIRFGLGYGFGFCENPRSPNIDQSTFANDTCIFWEKVSK